MPSLLEGIYLLEEQVVEVRRNTMEMMSRRMDEAVGGTVAGTAAEILQEKVERGGRQDMGEEVETIAQIGSLRVRPWVQGKRKNEGKHSEETSIENRAREVVVRRSQGIEMPGGMNSEIENAELTLTGEIWMSGVHILPVGARDPIAEMKEKEEMGVVAWSGGRGATSLKMGRLRGVLGMVRGQDDRFEACFEFWSFRIAIMGRRYRVHIDGACMSNIFRDLLQIFSVHIVCHLPIDVVLHAGRQYRKFPCADISPSTSTDTVAISSLDHEAGLDHVLRMGFPNELISLSIPTQTHGHSSPRSRSVAPTATSTCGR